jgi:hypothetical protein
MGIFTSRSASNTFLFIRPIGSKGSTPVISIGASDRTPFAFEEAPMLVPELEVLDITTSSALQRERTSNNGTTGRRLKKLNTQFDASETVRTHR